MSHTVTEHDGAKTPGRSIMPPYLLLTDVLDESTAAGLLDFAIAREATFVPTGVGTDTLRAVDPNIRVSVGTNDLGPYKAMLKERLRALLPQWTERLGATPIEAPKFELQLVAHNDGAFYKRHIDTRTQGTDHSIRALSGVYYFHARPQAFSGGALRLYALGDVTAERFVDIAPEHNTMLVFPAWVPHEVLPVHCPSGRFADSRFAINCWVHKKTAAAPPPEAGQAGK